MYADICILFNKLIHLPGQAVRDFRGVIPTLHSPSHTQLYPGVLLGQSAELEPSMGWGRGSLPLAENARGLLQMRPRALPSLLSVLEATRSQLTADVA